jgi:LmbE family N-acetylglucosaminyl deacetylase
MTTRFELASIRRVLVVAPHPDDESLGCGGLLALLARQKTDVSVVFVTDGGASHRYSRKWPRARLASERRAEAATALTELGLAQAQKQFFNLQDADMPISGSLEWLKAVRCMADLMEEFCPDLILAPWRRDPHCDHRASWQMLRQALRTSDHSIIFEYAIWLEEFGSPADQPRPGEVESITIDISAVLDAKLRAIAAHQTQIGPLIDDDPEGFRLSADTIQRLTQPVERYWRDCDETH